jgi:hypothetical protein
MTFIEQNNLRPNFATSPNAVCYWLFTGDDLGLIGRLQPEIKNLKDATRIQKTNTIEFKSTL